MPKWISAIFVFFLSTSLLTAKAKTVDDVLHHYMNAVAAQQKTDSLTSWYDVGTSIPAFENIPVYTPAQSAKLKMPSLFYFIRHGSKPELLGIEQIASNACYELKLVLESPGELHYFIDAESWQVRYAIKISTPREMKPGYSIFDPAKRALP